MTDAATLLPVALPQALPAAGGAPLRPVDAPVRVGDGGPGEAGATDPFAAVLLGFLGAALPAPPPPAPAPAGGTTGVASGPEALAAALPAGPGTLPAAAGAYPEAAPPPAAAGNDLPLTDAGLPVPASAPASTGPGDEPASTAATPLPELPAPGEPDGTAPPDPRPAANLRAQASDGREAAALLADLARSRAALPAQPARKPLPGGTIPAAGAADAAAPTGMPLAAETPADALLAAAVPPPAAVLDLAAGRPATGSPDVTAASALTITRGDGTPGGGPVSGTLAPLGDGASFASGLGERLLALGGDGVSTARLRLHPESLGALDVRIQIDDGEARIWFNTASAQTRDAIEATLPRLRDLFAQQGIDLGRVQVDIRNDAAALAAGGAGTGGPGTDGGPRARNPWDAPELPTPRSGRPPWSGAEAVGTARGPAPRLLDVLA